MAFYKTEDDSSRQNWEKLQFYCFGGSNHKLTFIEK